MAIHLGADIGTTSAKCLAVGEDGRVIAFAQQAYAMSHPRQGWAQDPEDYSRGLVATVRESVDQLTKAGLDAESVAGMALSTQGDTLIVTDHAAQSLLPAITWMDARSPEDYSELLSEAGAEFWYRETGTPFNPFSSACSIRWVQKDRPDAMAAGPARARPGRR